MKNKLTQCDLVALYIAQKNGEWVYSYDLKKAPFITHKNISYKIGSEGDRRAQELFEQDQLTTEHSVEGVKIALEREFEGKYRKYRAVGVKTPPRYQIVVDDELGIARRVLV